MFTAVSEGWKMFQRSHDWSQLSVFYCNFALSAFDCYHCMNKKQTMNHCRQGDKSKLDKSLLVFFADLWVSRLKKEEMNTVRLKCDCCGKLIFFFADAVTGNNCSKASIIHLVLYLWPASPLPAERFRYCLRSNNVLTSSDGDYAYSPIYNPSVDGLKPSSAKGEPSPASRLFHIHHSNIPAFIL